MNNKLNFRGSFVHQIDAKGRLSIPSVYRQTLVKAGVDSLIVTNFICDGARCLEGYSKPDWEQFENKLAERSRFDPQVRKLETFYLARAVECVIDSAGRINIPQNLRDYAGLERDITLAGSIYGFRIWDKRVWDVVFTEAEQALLDNPEVFLNVDV